MAALEANRTQFESLNANVLAINPASVTSHENYCNKKGFNFPILSDPDSKTVAAFKCLKDTGKGVQRTVYAADPEGKVIFAERGQADYKTIMDVIKNTK